MDIRIKDKKISVFKEHGFHYAILFALVFINIFLFSSVSPIHDILNLQYDQLVYHLIGKGMKYGKIPYLDLIDHKGIYLFSIYALGELICEYRHIGLFIVTLLINYVYAIYAYKISYILSKRKMTSLLTSFAIVVLQNTYFLSVNGLDCETTILPFIMIAFYLMIEYLMSDKKIYPLRYIYIDGILFGIILFIKANACLVFLAIALIVLVEHIKAKAWKHLFFTFAFGLLGVIIAILPGIIYCVATGSLSAMIEHSFLVNIKYLGTGYPEAKTIGDAFLKTYDKLKTFTIVAIISVFTLCYLLKDIEIVNDKEKYFKILKFYIVSLCFTIYAVFAACRPYTHYMILLLPYYIPVFLFFIINSIKFVENKKTLKILFILSIIVFNLLSYNLNLEIGLMNGVVQQNLCYKFKKIYNKEKSSFSKKMPSVYVVGYAMYIYETLDIFPNEKYFATPVVLRKDYSRPYDEAIKHIDSGAEEFIILAYSRVMNIDESFRNDVERVLVNKYEIVGQFSEIDQKLIVYKRK